MSEDATRFLTSFAQALSTMALYPEGHPAREGIIDTAFQNLVALQKVDLRTSFSFLGDEVLFGQRPIRELRGWTGAAASPRPACNACSSSRR